MEEIWKFINDNPQLLTDKVKDVQVTTLRRILPLLLMETYVSDSQPFIRKGKWLFLRFWL